MLIQSFVAAADFALFRDPSVTASPTTYVIPPKSAILGLLGGLIGIKRSRSDEDYSEEYRKLLSETKIGIEMLFDPMKIAVTTNHIALKRGKKSVTKPVKMEFVMAPKYRVYVTTGKKYAERLDDALSNNAFVYTPYLGHCYCLARISEYEKFDARVMVGDQENVDTSSVAVEARSETSGKPCLEIRSVNTSRVVIERQLFHYVAGDELKKTVLKHYAPINGSMKVDLSKEEIMTLVQAKGKKLLLY